VRHFLILFVIIIFISGCRNTSDPTITHADTFLLSKEKKNTTEIVSEIENSKFLFVKKGNIYYLVKDSNIKENK